MNYLFDTDCLNFFYKKSLPQRKAIQNRIASLNPLDNLQVSVLTFYELEYSIVLASSEKKKREIKTLIETAKRQFEVRSLNIEGSPVYSKLKGHLRLDYNINRENIKKYNIDLMIAATAASEDSVLVSGDKVYQKLADVYPQLQVEDWTV